MSAPLHELAAKWEATRKEADDWGLPEFSSVWVRASAAGAPADVEARVDAALESNRGWARFQSAASDGAQWRPCEHGRGRLIAAEWVEAAKAGVSYRVGPDPTTLGGTRLYTLEESGAGPRAGEDGWRPALAQEVRLSGHQEDRDLVYRVYFGAPGQDWSAIRRLFARFVGFTREPRP